MIYFSSLKELLYDLKKLSEPPRAMKDACFPPGPASTSGEERMRYWRRDEIWEEDVIAIVK